MLVNETLATCVSLEKPTDLPKKTSAGYVKNNGVPLGRSIRPPSNVKIKVSRSNGNPSS